MIGQTRPALIPFITAGDPSLEETEKLIYTLEAAGADLIELGVPFSDPMADGPVIQASYERALKHGVTLSKILDLVERVRKKTQIPILLMGYYNPVFAMGIETFAKRAKQAGLNAVLIVDLTPEEAGEVQTVLENANVKLVFLLAPTSDKSRIRLVSQKVTGFIYYVSLTGVTGAQLTVNREIGHQIAAIRKQTQVPIAVGFGIQKPEQARQIIQDSKADGVVIGSALVALIHQNSLSSNLHNAVHQYMQAFRTVLHK